MNKLCKSFLLCALWCIVVSVPVLGTTPSVPVSGSAVCKKGSGSLILRNSIVWDNMFNSTNADEAASATNLVGTDPKFLTDTRFVLQPSSTANKKGDVAYNSLGKSIEGWSHTDNIVASGAYGTTVGVSVQTDGRVAVSMFTSLSKDLASQIISNEPVPYGTNLYIVEGVAIKDCSSPVLIFEDNSVANVSWPYRMTGLHVVRASASLNPVVYYGVYEATPSGLTSHNNIFYDNQQLNCNFNPDVTDLMNTDPKFVSDTRFALSLASPAIKKGNYTYNNLDKSIEGWEYYDNINSSGAFGTPVGITVQTDGNATVRIFTSADADPDSEILSGQPVRYKTPLWIIEGTPSKGYQIKSMIINDETYWTDVAKPFLLMETSVLKVITEPNPYDHYGLFSKSETNLKVFNNISYDNVHGNYNEPAGATNIVEADPLFVESGIADTDFRHFTLQHPSPAGKTGLRVNNPLLNDIAEKDFLTTEICRYIPSGAYYDDDPMDIRTAGLTVCTSDPSITVDLTSNERTTYQYSDNGIQSIKYYQSDKVTQIVNPASVSVGAGTTAVYYAQGTTSLGSMGIFEEIRIKVDAIPTVTVTNQDLCLGETYTLTNAVSADAGLSLRYYTESGGIYTELNGSGLDIHPATAAIYTYYVQATNNTTTCQSNYIPILVTVNSLPVLTLKSNYTDLAQICGDAGATLDLSTLVASYSNGDMHYYSDPSCAEVSKLSSSVVTGSGTYYLRAENSTTGCTSVAQAVTVAIRQAPTPTLVSPVTTASKGESGVLYTTQSGMNNYVWSITNGTINSGQGTYQVSVTWGNTSPGNISVTYKSPEGCSASAAASQSVTLNTQSDPGITAGSGSFTVCPDNNNSYTYTTESGKLNYDWTIEGGEIIGGGDGNNTVTVRWAGATPGSVKVSYRHSANVPLVEATQSVTKQKVTSITTQPQGNTAVCYNGSHGMSVVADCEVGTTTYQWKKGTDNVGTNSASYTATSSGSYTVEVTGVCGSATSSAAVVTVKNQPSAELSGASGVVATQQEIYTAGAGSNYNWTVTGGTYTGGTSTDQTVTVTWGSGSSGSVKVSYTVDGCPTTEEEVAVTISPQGTPTLENPVTTVCYNTSQTYTTQAGMSDYSWTIAGATSVTGDDTNTVTVTWGLAGEGTIQVSYKEVPTALAVSSQVQNITINDRPSIMSITPPFGVCDGAALTLTAPTVTAVPSVLSGNEGWKLNGNAFTSGSTVSYTQSGQTLLYYATNACGTRESNTVAITVNPLPTVNLTASNDVCLDTDITFSTEAGKSNYVWNLGGATTVASGTGTNTSNTATLRWDNSGSKTVSVNYTDANGCTATASRTKTVTVKGKETATIDGYTTVYTTQQVAYTAGSGSNYLWNFDGATVVSGGTSATPVVKWATTGSKTISVSYTGTNGCPTSTAETEITVSAQGTPTLISPATPVCYNTPVTYNTQTGKSKYKWTVTGSGTINGADNAATVSVTWTAAGTGTIKVAYSQDAAADAIESSVENITVNGAPTISAISTPSGVCDNSALTLIAPTVTSIPSADSQGWKLDGISFTSGSTVTYAQNSKALYYEATNTCGTTQSNSVDITVYELPTVTATALSICPGSSINLTTAVTNPNGYTSQFYAQAIGGTPLSGSTVTPSANTTYYVSAENGNGCVSASRTAISVTLKTVTSITVQPVAPGTVGIGNSFSLNVTAVGENLSYQWYRGTTTAMATAFSGETSATLSIASTNSTDYGVYYVIVTGDCGSPVQSNSVVVDILSSDATLKDLLVNGTSLPDFDPQITEYTYTVLCDVDLADITGTPNHQNAMVSNLTSQRLEPGDNEYVLMVTAENGLTTKTYTIKIVRDCYVPEITKDLENAVICIGESHTFGIIAEGHNLTYEWYYGNNRIWGANSNTYTVTDAKPNDYEQYHVIVRSNFNGYQASVYSKNARLWVADNLPETLLFSDYPNPAKTGETYHIKLAGYSDVTKYSWSYSKEGVAFSPETGATGENETWATFGTLSEGTGTLTATLEHPCGTRQATRTIVVQYPMGTDDVTGTTVQVSPNPTSGLIKVSNTEPNQTIRITDVTGSLKGTYPTREGVTTIDLTGYAKGTYLLQYNDKTFKVIRK